MAKKISSAPCYSRTGKFNYSLACPPKPVIASGSRAKAVCWRIVASCTPPFGLLIIASILRQNKVEVSILDCNADKISLDLVNRSLTEKDVDLVGVTATTSLINNALEIAKISRKHYPKAKDNSRRHTSNDYA